MATLSISRGTARRGYIHAHFVEGRLSEEQPLGYRRETGGKGIPSYPHPWLVRYSKLLPPDELLAPMVCNGQITLNFPTVDDKAFASVCSAVDAAAVCSTSAAFCCTIPSSRITAWLTS